VKGLFTHDDKLIEVFGHRNRDHLQLVKTKYKEMFGKNLENEIDAKSMGNFRHILLGLLIPIIPYKTQLLNNAVKGVGTDDEVLIDIITQSSNDELQQIKTLYGKEYGGGNPTKLEEEIKGDTWFNLKKVLIQVLKGSRSEGGSVSESEAATDAELLYQKGENRLLTDDSTFINIMTSRSVPHLDQVSKYYQQKHGKPLKEAIIAETSGNYKDALIALSTLSPQYWADRTKNAVLGYFKGLGTKDSLVVRIFTLNDKNQLQKIKETYKNTYGITMEQDLADDTSGSYRKLLMALLEPN